MRVAALWVFVVVSALGQEQKIEYSVHGTVRDAVSREPIKNALIMLGEITMPSGGAASLPPARAMLTGPAGEFQFQGLSKGDYLYTVRKPGYADGYDPEGLFAVPGTRESSSMEVNLTPLGAIEGKVVDQYDEALENVVLDVYQFAIIDGEKRATNVGRVWTDDLGSFHLAYLNPGKYCVKAQARRGGTETQFGIQAMHYAPWEAFAPVYFGGGSDISSATITVTAGARARADFHLEMQPAFRIRGRVRGATASDTVNFELVQNDNLVAPSRALLDVSTGEFEILDVIPGNYKLRAGQEKTRGEAAVHVAGDVSGVSIALMPPVTLHGSMRQAGGAGNVTAGAASCQLMLAGKRSPDARYASSPTANGQFEIPGVFPDEYQTRLQCFGGYPLSASFGNADILRDPTVRISADAAPPPIEVEYKRGGGMLKVKFAGKIPTHSAMLLVPDFSPSTGPSLRRNPTAERDGVQPAETTLLDLAPGDYMVYGLARYEDAEFRNPEFLRTLSSGASVHIEDGKTAEITLGSFCQ